MRPDRIYGLDIETDTSVDGLDPRVSPVVAVAVATESRTFVFDGDEAALLRDVDIVLATLPPGVIVTWNGSGFDLPFLADRARVQSVDLALRLEPRHERSADGHDALPGHEGAYRGAWGRHGHLDGYRVYRADVGASARLPCGLKPLARLVGLRPVEVDRTDIGALSRAELHDYVASDAVVARELVVRRWPACEPGIDRLGEPPTR